MPILTLRPQTPFQCPRSRTATLQGREQLVEDCESGLPAKTRRRTEGNLGDTEGLRSPVSCTWKKQKLGMDFTREESTQMSCRHIFFLTKRVFRVGLGSSTSKSVVDQARMRKKKTMLQLMCKFFCGEKFKVPGMF